MIEIHKTHIKMKVLETQVIFLNIKGPELLHQDCGSVCVVCVSK